MTQEIHETAYKITNLYKLCREMDYKILAMTRSTIIFLNFFHAF